MAAHVAIAKQLPGRNRPPGEHSLLVRGLAGLSASAGVVHLSVIAGHFREDIFFGLFFLALSAFQLGWVLVVLLRPGRHLYSAAGLVNAVVILTWILSRTIGIPIGPAAGIAEPVGRADLLSTLIEAILVAGCLTALRPLGEAASRKIGRAVLVMSVAAAPLTGLVSVSTPGETHGHHEVAADQGHHGVPALHHRDAVSHSGHLAEHVVLGGASAVFGGYLIRRRLRKAA